MTLLITSVLPQFARLSNEPDYARRSNLARKDAHLWLVLLMNQHVINQSARVDARISFSLQTEMPFAVSVQMLWARAPSGSCEDFSRNNTSVLLILSWYDAPS